MRNLFLIILINISFIATEAQAELEGGLSLKELDHDLALVKGPKNKCSSESIRFLAKKNVLILGNSQSFSFEEASGELSEPAEKGQCHYKEKSKITNREIEVSTTRTNCPKASENGELVEHIRLISEKNRDLLIYQNRFNKKSFECQYSIFKDSKKDLESGKK